MGRGGGRRRGLVGARQRRRRVRNITLLLPTKQQQEIYTQSSSFSSARAPRTLTARSHRPRRCLPWRCVTTRRTEVSAAFRGAAVSSPTVFSVLTLRQRWRPVRRRAATLRPCSAELFARRSPRASRASSAAARPSRGDRMARLGRCPPRCAVPRGSTSLSRRRSARRATCSPSRGKFDPQRPVSGGKGRASTTRAA